MSIPFNSDVGGNEKMLNMQVYEKKTQELMRKSKKFVSKNFSSSSLSADQLQS